MATGYLWDELYGWYDTGSGSLMPADPAAGLQPVSHQFSHPDTKRRMHELIAVSGLARQLTTIAPRPATHEEILRAHTPAHLDRILRESELPKGGDAGDGVSPFGKGGFEIAALAAGGAIAMVDAVVSGKVDNGFALVNPCGHHAVAETGMGFCVFNNVAIATQHAREVLGIERVAIVDWDVHHGNGSQAIFWEDPNVLTLSVHQDRNFPANSGLADERGSGAGIHTNLNVPLPPGTGDAGYVKAIEDVVVPALRQFAPGLVIVACGFDANGFDPLARQMVSADGFATMANIVKAAAAEICSGQVVFVQEGGYSIHYVPVCGLLTVAALAGLETLADPYLAAVEQQYGRMDLEDHQVRAIEHSRSLVGDIPGR
ncbi:class II histone deacetylase [Aeromicrobium sp. CF3.5]|uniref:class II histone deacetylase n=1 Tax=Aeromicrobium sp. CF3.5 TaxID=3373078 RepID=UPI003EE7259B